MSDSADSAGYQPTRGYRSFFTIADQPNALDLVKSQVAQWLREKGWDVDLSVSGFHRGEAAHLTVLSEHVRHDDVLRVRLEEESALGLWSSDLVVASSDAADGWMSITVSNDQNRFVDVPRVATYILDVVRATDGPSELTSEPSTLSTQGLDDLLEELCDPDRNGLLFVAGTSADGDLFQPFVERLGLWTRQTRGLARVVVLDPHATAQFADAVGRSHAVPAWTIRTFFPDVDPAVAADGLRHRILGHAGLASRTDHDIRRLLGRIAREQAATRELPSPVLRTIRSMARIEAQQVVSGLRIESAPAATVLEPVADEVAVLDAVVVDPEEPVVVDARVAEPSPDPNASAAAQPQPEESVGHSVAVEASAYLATVELVKRALGLDELTEESLAEIATRVARVTQIEHAVARVTEQLESQQLAIERLEDEVAIQREFLTEAELDLAIASEQTVRAEAEAVWLRKKLVEARSSDAAYAAVPAEAYPDYPVDVDDLLARMADLAAAGVVFCGDAGEARELGDIDTLGQAVRTAWDSVLALCDYVRARSDGLCNGGLDTYMRSTPSGFRAVPPKKFAQSETGRTMRDFGDERLFPVPVEVDPSGYAEMKAHFKLARIGMASPRMYVLDRFLIDGRVYIGYVGTHLTNTQSN